MIYKVRLLPLYFPASKESNAIKSNGVLIIESKDVFGKPKVIEILENKPKIIEILDNMSEVIIISNTSSMFISMVNNIILTTGDNFSSNRLLIYSS